MRGFDLDLAVLRIHSVNTFRNEKYSRILTSYIYLKRNTFVYKGIDRGFLGGVMNARGSQT